MSVARGFPGGALIALATALLLAAPASAQRNVPGTLQLTLSSATVGFPTPGVADFDARWIEHPGFVVSVSSRPPTSTWELRVRADAADLGGYGKSVSDLLWRTEGSAMWTPLTGSDEPIAAGQGDTEITVYFRLLLDWEHDQPDVYSAGLTFSVIRP